MKRNTKHSNGLNKHRVISGTFPNDVASGVRDLV